MGRKVLVIPILFSFKFNFDIFYTHLKLIAVSPRKHIYLFTDFLVYKKFKNLNSI